MDRYPEEQFVNSLIGFGSLFKGDIEIDGLFRIDGDFIGSIRTEGKVLIGSNGRADCTINARVVVIGGVFRGTVYAEEKILILSSAVVIGNLYTPRLVAEEGVIIHSTLLINGKKERSRTAVKSRSRQDTQPQALLGAGSHINSEPSSTDHGEKLKDEAVTGRRKGFFSRFGRNASRQKRVPRELNDSLEPLEESRNPSGLLGKPPKKSERNP